LLGRRGSMPKLVRRIALLAIAPLLFSGCVWLDVGGNAMHTGFNPLETSVRSDNFAGLHRVWTAAVPSPNAGDQPSSVAVFGNSLFIESEQGVLLAYNAVGDTNCSGTPRSCLPLWTAAAGGPIPKPVTVPMTDPATDGATVFVGGNDGNLYAFDAAGETNCS